MTIQMYFEVGVPFRPRSGGGFFFSLFQHALSRFKKIYVFFHLDNLFKYLATMFSNYQFKRLHNTQERCSRRLPSTLTICIIYVSKLRGLWAQLFSWIEHTTPLKGNWFHVDISTSICMVNTLLKTQWSLPESWIPNVTLFIIIWKYLSLKCKVPFPLS